MEGKLKHNGLGQIMCDKCGERLVYSSVKTSQSLREFIGAVFSKRKVWHLCLGCTRKFTEGHTQEVKK